MRIRLREGPTSDTSWQEFSSCLGVNPDLFFPEKGQSQEAAKEVCRGCPVREDCLDYALENKEKFGIWGGASERERRRLRVQRSRARAALAQRVEVVPMAEASSSEEGSAPETGNESAVELIGRAAIDVFDPGAEFLNVSPLGPAPDDSQEYPLS